MKSWVFGKLRQTVKETKSSPQITLSGPHKKDESSKGVPFPGREGRALWPGETEPPVLTALPPPHFATSVTPRDPLESGGLGPLTRISKSREL